MLSQSRVHLNKNNVLTDAFYYLYNKVIITENNSKIMIYKENSLLVIKSPPSLKK